MPPLCPPSRQPEQESTREAQAGSEGTAGWSPDLQVTEVRPAGGSREQPTWGDEEGSPQFLVARDVPDLPGHVDHPAGHGRHAAEVQDPGGRGVGGVLAAPQWLPPVAPEGPGVLSGP